MLNIPWSQTHAEAHFLEHTVSAMLEEQMRTNLGNPTTCPHGNPMPGYEAVTAAWRPLTEIEPGEEVVLRRVHEFAESQPELMRTLENHDLLPGARLSISETHQDEQALTLQSNGRSLSLGLPSASLLFVERNPVASI
jgi:DtxR family Mn-dependent transcriptional regulator